MFPIPGVPRDLDISASVFSDFGTVAKIDVPSNIKYSSADYWNTNKMRVSVGVSLMWITHIGPLRIDVARALRKEPYDKTQLMHVSMSTLL